MSGTEAAQLENLQTFYGPHWLIGRALTGFRAVHLQCGATIYSNSISGLEVVMREMAH